MPVVVLIFEPLNMSLVFIPLNMSLVEISASIYYSYELHRSIKRIQFVSEKQNSTMSLLFLEAQ